MKHFSYSLILFSSFNLPFSFSSNESSKTVQEKIEFYNNGWGSFVTKLRDVGQLDINIINFFERNDLQRFIGKLQVTSLDQPSIQLLGGEFPDIFKELSSFSPSSLKSLFSKFGEFYKNDKNLFDNFEFIQAYLENQKQREQQNPIKSGNQKQSEQQNPIKSGNQKQREQQNPIKSGNQKQPEQQNPIKSGNQNQLKQQHPIKSGNQNQNETIQTISSYFEVKDVNTDDPNYLQFKNLFAKINEACNFEGKVRFCHISHFKEPGSITKDTGICSIELKVEDGKIAFPYFFVELIIYPSKEKNNVCHSGYTSDSNIINALNSSHLGTGAKWNQNDIQISNWMTKWEKGQLVFIVIYNGQPFILIPTKDKDQELDNITSDKWHTSTGKKIAIGAAAVAATVGAVYAARTYYQKGKSKSIEDDYNPQLEFSNAEINKNIKVQKPLDDINEKNTDKKEITKNFSNQDINNQTINIWNIDPHINREMARSIGNKRWFDGKQWIDLNWAVANMAEKISEFIETFINLKNSGFAESQALESLTLNFFRYKQTVGPVFQKTLNDPNVGKLNTQTWKIYEIFGKFLEKQATITDVQNQIDLAHSEFNTFYSKYRKDCDHIIQICQQTGATSGNIYHPKEYTLGFPGKDNTHPFIIQAISNLIGIASIEMFLNFYQGQIKF